jgi:hypothetical protein
MAFRISIAKIDSSAKKLEADGFYGSPTFKSVPQPLGAAPVNQH